MENLEEFVKDFVIESQEGLQQLENDLVALEENPQHAGRLDSIFRILHTVKGSSGFLEFEQLRDLAHAGEALLSRLRCGELAMTAQISNVLFTLVDAIRAILKNVDARGQEGTTDYAELKGALVQLVQEGKVPPPVKQPAMPPVTPQPAMAPPEPSLPGKQAQPDDPQQGAGPETHAFTPGPADGSDAQRLPTPVRLGRGGSLPPTGPQEETSPPVAPQQLMEQTTDQLPAEVLPSATNSQVTPAAAPTPPDAAPSTPAAATPDLPPRDKREGSGTGLSASNIRVDVDLLDHLMNLVGELVLTRNRMVQITSDHQDPDLLNTIQRLSQITSSLQDGTMKTRMQTIGTMWQKIPRIVRDVAGQCGKKVQLVMEGTETELDKSLIEALGDPLLHLVRNAIDHGIETPPVRRVGGKPETGTLTLRAFHQGGQVIIEIADDGAGLDTAKIAQKALQRGLFSADESLSLTAEQIQESIFLPGFSTADRVSKVSGRGVGMDVVKTNIERIGGTVNLKSKLKQGTTVRITVPLTLAIIPALIIHCAGDRYAIPQVNVVELVRSDDESGQTRIERVHDARVLRLRDRLVPLANLADLLQVRKPGEPADVEGTHVAVLRASDRQFALLVDSIANTQEIVVKPLSSALKNIGVYAGSTIMGDGGIALILDALGLARRSGLFLDEAARSMARLPAAASALAPNHALLICEIDGGRRIGVPLSRLTRIEAIEPSVIESSGGRSVVQEREGIMPLIDLAGILGTGVPATGARQPAADRLQVIVHSRPEGNVGLIVDRVLDITALPAGAHAADGDPLTGSAVILGRVTDIIDIGSLDLHALFERKQIGAEPQTGGAAAGATHSAQIPEVLSQGPVP